MTAPGHPVPLAVSPLLRAGLWMIGSILSFSAMAVAGRMVKDRHDTFEILAFRSLVGVVLVVSVATLTGHIRRIRARRLHAHALRNTVHFTGQALWFHAIAMIPLAQVIALEFTSPLWVVLASPFLLGERLTPGRLAAALIGLAGVYVVAQPDFARIDLGVASAFTASIFFAATQILTKRLTRQEEIVTILFWLVIFQTVYGFVLAGWDGAITLPDRHTAPWLALIGLAGLSAHYCLTSALALAPASQVVPMDFARLPLVALIGALVFHEPLTLGLALGAALILGANYLSLRSAPPPPSSPPATT